MKAATWLAPRPASGNAALFLRGVVGVAEAARLEFRRIEDDLRPRLAELIEVGALDALVLDEQHLAFFPLAVVGEFHVARYRLERGGVDILRELGLVEAADLGDRVAQDLHLGIGEGRACAPTGRRRHGVP